MAGVAPHDPPPETKAANASGRAPPATGDLALVVSVAAQTQLQCCACARRFEARLRCQRFVDRRARDLRPVDALRDDVAARVERRRRVRALDANALDFALDHRRIAAELP